MRTGPDLFNIGARQPSKDWHLLHLYNPQAVVKDSIMPPYRFLFRWVRSVGEDDTVVRLPEPYAPEEGYIVPTEQALPWWTICWLWIEPIRHRRCPNLKRPRSNCHRDNRQRTRTPERKPGTRRRDAENPDDRFAVDCRADCLGGGLLRLQHRQAITGRRQPHGARGKRQQCWRRRRQWHQRKNRVQCPVCSLPSG